jgi:hypothetical protein
MYANSIIECDIPIDIAQLPNSSLWGSSSEKMKTLCWFILEMGRIERFIIPSNLDTYVHEKFTAHGKKLIGDREIMKAINTTKMFQDWKTISNGQGHQHIIMTAGQSLK